jgi:hypothetical protein
MQHAKSFGHKKFFMEIFDQYRALLEIPKNVM